MKPYLSLAVLAYNERDTIESAARRCSAVLESIDDTYELVLVDDGSMDGSAAIMDDLALELPCCRVIHHPGNLGIGAGIRTCYFATRGQWATWFPADLQADPGELPRLLEYLPRCDVLATYREAHARQATAMRKLISFTDRTLVRLLFGLALKDLHWIRFFRRDLLDRMCLACHSPSVDTEMMVCAKRMEATILQVPLPDHPRRAGVARGARLKNIVTSVSDLVCMRCRRIRLAQAKQQEVQAASK